MSPQPSAEAKVVFIVSQPRAGATLLQALLGGHPRVTALGQTRIMLPLVRGVSGATQAACQRAGADVLLDKTPRYYWIIDELLHMLPESRIIILLRDPIAVLSSMIQTCAASSSVGSLALYRADLLEAPARLAGAIESGDDQRVQKVHYEQLVTDSDNVLAQLQTFLGLDIVESLSGSGQDTVAHRKSLEKWLPHAATSALGWRLMDDYRQFLGAELLTRLGYNPQLLADKLQDIRPPGTTIAPSLASLVNRKAIQPLRSILLLRSMAANAVSRVARSAA